MASEISSELEIAGLENQMIECMLVDYAGILVADLDTGEGRHIRTDENAPSKLTKRLDEGLFAFFDLLKTEYMPIASSEHAGRMFDKDYMIERLREDSYYYVMVSLGDNEQETHRYEIKIMKYGDWTKKRTVLIATICIDSKLSEETEIRNILEESVAQRTRELEERNHRLNRINEEIIRFLGDIVEARDVESGEHVRRVRGFTHILGEQVMKDCPEYMLTPAMVDLITSASALHDLGKIMIPDAIVLKPGKLTANEFETMKTHSEKGAEILKYAPKEWSDEYLKTSLDICRYHHEKYDGSGYPEGLKGDEIPISAQIVSVVDCLDALINERVYKDAYDFDLAFDMIVRGECGVFSDKIMKCFKKVKEELREHALNQNSVYSYTTPDITAENLYLAGIRVLLVEDEEISRDLTYEVLTGAGALVTTAKNGEEAIDILKEAPRDSFDAILMDIYLPGMNGFETTEKIRRSRAYGAETIPIIAISSSHSDQDIKLATEAGMSSYLFKPLSINLVQKALMSSIRNQTIELQHKLTKTSRLANRDQLTGVRSMAAYTEKVEELKEDIRRFHKTEFALVECDLNGLKQVNDTYGHEIGDVYIVNGCRAICNVFKHSPVFRIGGDEFVVVLQDTDYENRHALMEELKESVAEALKKKDAIHGRISLAAGLSDYDPKTDKSVSDVLKRADISMYNNKRMMHMTITD